MNRAMFLPVRVLGRVGPRDDCQATLARARCRLLRPVSLIGLASARGTASAGLSTPCPWCRSPFAQEALWARGGQPTSTPFKRLFGLRATCTRHRCSAGSRCRSAVLDKGDVPIFGLPRRSSQLWRKRRTDVRSPRISCLVAGDPGPRRQVLALTRREPASGASGAERWGRKRRGGA